MVATETIVRKVVLCCLLLFLILAPTFGISQTPDNASIREADICQILRDPAAFDGQILRFRGRLEFEFEGDHVDDSTCGQPVFHTAIWWTFGGEPLLHSEATHVGSLTSPVLKNGDFDKFQEFVHAHRALRPDREMCESHRACAYYDVVATYTGRFFAGKMRSGRTLADGFGHMGCCHLFVIEQVSEVEARRTPVPDEKLKFSCASTSWQSEYPALTFSNSDARLAANKQFLIDQVRAHGDDSLVEAMESEPPLHFLGITGYLVLSSPDLLTTYTAKFPESMLRVQTAKKHQSPPAAVPIIMNVSRERCEPTVN